MGGLGMSRFLGRYSVSQGLSEREDQRAGRYIIIVAELWQNYLFRRGFIGSPPTPDSSVTD